MASKVVLSLQIKSGLYAREGRSINNFKNTLPEARSDLAASIIKDLYNLEFLDIHGKFHEKELKGSYKFSYIKLKDV